MATTRHHAPGASPGNEGDRPKSLFCLPYRRARSANAHKNHPADTIIRNPQGALIRHQRATPNRAYDAPIISFAWGFLKEKMRFSLIAVTSLFTKTYNAVTALAAGEDCVNLRHLRLVIVALSSCGVSPRPSAAWSASAGRGLPTRPGSRLDPGTVQATLSIRRVSDGGSSPG